MKAHDGFKRDLGQGMDDGRLHDTPTRILNGSRM